ncbi:translation initiation factor IF-2-like [Cuculus canorus]|uniref:translation initiation factor IF-2-like n=1 Tax=Cuculus canorus TaxID=55661 RepID=UPI0023AA5D92|nr:translation initiation factor IF-2-like [Cuculus canorus]
MVPFPQALFLLMLQERSCRSVVGARDKQEKQVVRQDEICAVETSGMQWKQGGMRLRATRSMEVSRPVNEGDALRQRPPRGVTGNGVAPAYAYVRAPKAQKHSSRRSPRRPRPLSQPPPSRESPWELQSEPRGAACWPCAPRSGPAARLPPREAAPALFANAASPARRGTRRARAVPLPGSGAGGPARGPEQGATPPPARPGRSAAARTGHGGHGAGNVPGSRPSAPVMPRGGAHSSPAARRAGVDGGSASRSRRLHLGPGWPRRGQAPAERTGDGVSFGAGVIPGRAAAASPATSSSTSCTSGSSSRCPTSGSAASAAGMKMRVRSHPP